MSRSLSSAVFVVAGLAFVGGAVACSAAAKKNTDDGSFIPSGDGNGDPPLPPPRDPDINNDDAGAFGVGDRGKDGGGGATDSGGGRGGQDSGGDPVDSGGNLPPIDAGGPDATPVVDGGGAPSDACPGALAAGDLAVVELMIASQTGAGDKGEWVEVQSTRN